jgi:CRP-like cAMP-binding protein
LQLREFLLDSDIRTPAKGDTIFAVNDYTDSFFSVLRGKVRVQVNPDRPEQQVTLTEGQFFGEMSLISGRRRSATVIAGSGCVLIETPRRSMSKLINSVESVKRTIDQEFLRRTLGQQLAAGASRQDLAQLAAAAQIMTFQSGEV